MVRALSMSTRNGTSGSRHCRIVLAREEAMGNCAGVDWASEKHDVLIEDRSAVSCWAQRSRMTRTA